MSELYKVLKRRSSDLFQREVDSLSTTLKIMAKHFDKIHPDHKGFFEETTTRLQDHLNNFRDQRFSAYDVFKGDGPVARRIKEHAALMEIFHPANTPRVKDVLAQVEEQFHKQPIKDEAQLEDLVKFIRMTKPLMSGQQIPGQTFDPLEEGASLAGRKSGFYAIPSGPFMRAAMVVSTTLGEGAVEVTYVLEMGHDDLLLFKHPEEDEWFVSDGDFTFDGLVPKLQAELDAMITPLGLSASFLDMDAEMIHIYDKADYIFNNYDRIPSSGVMGVKHEKDETTLYIPVNPEYHWKFMDTRGQYPQRTYKFFQQMAGTSIIQSADPAGFNEFTRQNIIKAVNKELDRIIGSLAPETEAAEAA
jgi:hypothetical protein